MQLDSLQVCQFRNIAQCSLEFCSGFNIFYGDNGQGKSNLLEAIYILSFLKGFRGAHLSELIMQGASGAQLAATLNREGACTRLGLELTEKQRKIQVDREPCQRLTDFLGILKLILFVPSDVSLLQAPPAERRTFLDRMVFNLQPSYLQVLEMYNKNLKMKSAELRQETPNEGMLDVYDQALLDLGSRLIAMRYRYFEALAPYLAQSFSAIFDDSFSCEIMYSIAGAGTHIFSPGMASTLDEKIHLYQQKLSTSRKIELIRRQNCSGPHRDDWSLLLNGREGRYFASQGQQRSMIIAIKMAEIACIKNVTGIEPVFLLDDISSELDPKRNDRLTQHLYSLTTQTFLTTTSKNHFNLPAGARRFCVTNGTFTPED